ncbi:hypothetical protein G6F63_014141 [Rhizopus arrhizus]|nr:hypothetical protein G6F35_017087 [Rhizopus arrhizus]KAG1320677.1 hypothetical protein G6F63_014141 [Rhizopus arrhizus]
MQQRQCQGLVVGGDDKSKPFTGHARIVRCRHACGPPPADPAGRLLTPPTGTPPHPAAAPGAGSMPHAAVHRAPAPPRCSAEVPAAPPPAVRFRPGSAEPRPCPRTSAPLPVHRTHHHRTRRCWRTSPGCAPSATALRSAPCTRPQGPCGPSCGPARGTGSWPPAG